MDLLHLKDIAVEAARDAGVVIQQYLSQDVPVDKKQAGSSRASQVVTEVDRACEAVILSHLRPPCQTFDLALLSEETEDDGSRFARDFFWCVDPMDGTLPFIRKQPGFSVAIALVAQDGTPQLGVVFDPSTDTLYHAVKGHGAFKNHRPWIVEQINDYLTYVTDKPLRDTPQAAKIEELLRAHAAQLGLSHVEEMAGAGSVLNAIRVLEQGPACMLKLPKAEPGGGSLWDFAATACIFQELGLPATHFTGEKLDLNRKESTFMNHKGIFYANFK